MIRVFSSLTNRIFVVTALLALVSIAAAVWVVNVLVTAQAERELERGIEEAGMLVEHYRGLSASQLALQARLIADLPKFKAAVELGHPPTLKPLAIDYREQIESDLFVVTDRNGRILANEGVGLAVNDRPPVPLRSLDHELTWFLPREHSVLQVVTVPIWIDPAQPDIFGTLSVGIALDERFAARIKQLTDSDIAFGFGDRIVASTLPGASELLHEVRRQASPQHISVGDEEYIVSARPLADAPLGRRSAASAQQRPRPASAASAPHVLVLRSRTERLRFLRTLHTAVAVMAIVVVLGATLVSYGVSRTITRPLAAITATMREMASTGDLTRRVTLPGRAAWNDEDARLLANTFNAMTASIARFQREAGQRERLSSLGRLSTVIAHEVRNPLMIIKAALRTLRRPDLPPDRASAALTDIDEEIRRLNRLVTEVLDFARPIRFELAPQRLGPICERSWTAVTAALPSITARLVLDPAADEVVTDGERLRVALVNLLTNAAEAVQSGRAAAADVPDDAPDVELSTRALPGDRVQIVVRDRGPGIGAADLHRVFEPYFTTKRTGSGIGLAITRNVIEGLGGTIRVTSDRGTEVTIELPRRSGPPAQTSSENSSHAGVA